MTQSVDTEKNLPVSSGEDDMSQFLREIRQYPRLTPEEEKALARRCAAGDEDAIRQMVNSNLRLVVSIAREYAGRGVALLDLIQEGSIGLLTAARKFDYTMDCRFSTYATKWIRQGVTRCLINHGSPWYSRIFWLPSAGRYFLPESGRGVLPPAPHTPGQCSPLAAGWN